MRNRFILLEDVDTKPEDPIEPNNIDTYIAGKTYLVSYINKEGNDINIEYVPGKDMNIVEVISEIKNNNQDFFKLYGILENEKETPIRRFQDNQTVLKEDADINYVPSEPKDFKEYVENGLEEVASYIKDIRVQKKNRYDQWGVFIYCIDKNDRQGFITNIMYDENKEYVDNRIKDVKAIIENIYVKETQYSTKSYIKNK